MPDKILHKRSLTSGAIPNTSSLDLGELAINVADGKIHLRRSGSGNNDVVSIVTANTITTGSITATSFTGSLFGTSSWTQNYTESDPIFTSVSASFITTSSFNDFTSSIQNQVNSLTNATSSYILASQTSSFVTTSSFNSFTSSYTTGSFTGSFTGELIGTSSYATTASYALNSPGGGISETLAIAYAIALG